MRETRKEANKIARHCMRAAWLRNSLWYRFVHVYKDRGREKES